MRQRLGQAARLGAVLAVAIAGIVALWRLAHDTAAVKREAPPMAVVALTPPPPPPPPPPPKEKPPEPEKTVETPAPTPKPEATPKPDAAPKALTIEGPPQPGPNPFGTQAGAGGGMVIGGKGDGDGVGGGFGAGTYGNYLAGVFERAAQADPRTSRDVYSAQVEVWIAADGAITKVALLKSSGDARTDAALIDVLKALHRLDEPPPPQLKFPARVAFRGRRA